MVFRLGANKGMVSLALAVLLCGWSQVHSGQESLVPVPKERQEVLDKALGFLKSTQLADGSFAPKLAGPGVTAVVVAGLVRNGVSPSEPLLAKAMAYLEKQVKQDGGIYDKFLANYTTSVGVMAFKGANKDGKYDSVIKNASNFLKGLQHDAGDVNPAQGGFGYDKRSRPDLSNTSFTVEALIAAGVPRNDPAVQNALKFLSRCQNLPGETNDQAFAKNTTKDDKGGFTYHPFDLDKNQYKTPEGGLRSLGGMTYGGLKSFLYAGVSKEDPRVKAAVNWVRNHYTLEENPGMGKAGLYYYFHTFGKALDAWGEERFASADGKKHVWRRELFDALETRQQANGSWRNTGEKAFAEDNADLATAFAVLSLSYTKAVK